MLFRYEDIDGCMASHRNAPMRFRAKVRIEENGCWRWTGSLNKDGYAVMQLDLKVVRAHRWSYFYFRGPIPEGLEPDHLCRNRWCTNPWHLEAVTPRTNVLRGDTIPAHNWAKKFCERGHEFTGIKRQERNGHIYYSRHCQTCTRNQRRERDAIHGRSSRG